MQKPIIAYVINLKNSTVRRAGMQERIDQFFNQHPEFAGRIEFRFFHALSAKEKEHLKFPQAGNISLSKLIRGKALTDCECACYASHFSLWEQCVREVQPCIILEDDIAFKEEFARWLESALTSPMPEYVRLMALREVQFILDYPEYESAKSKNHMNQTLKKCLGSQGYYLSPHAAQKFLKHSKHWIFPVDDYMDMFFIHGVVTSVCCPYVIQDCEAVSDIGKRSARLNATQKLRREFFRLILQAWRFGYILFHPKLWK